MKTNKIILFIAAIFLFTNCNSGNELDVDKDVKDAFESQYKDAVSVEWDAIDGFWVAEFGYEESYCYSRAWYDNDAKWLMTETNQLQYDTYLPEEIINDYEFNWNYPKDEIVNIAKVEFRDVETRYIIEIENSSKHFFLFYRRKGELFKTVQSYWENRPIAIPQEIIDYIEKNHEQNTSIIDADMGGDPIKVEIDEKRHKTTTFDKSYRWLATYWKVEIDDVTEAALQALQNIEGIEGKVLKEQFKLIYNSDIEANSQLEKKKISLLFLSDNNYIRVYVFKFEDGTQIYIDEYGKEITEINISL